jgi:tRNA-dihydrouridine synthase
LHPRTAKEKLKRLARWSYVGTLRQELHIPVAGNGDIANAGDLLSRARGLVDGKAVNLCDAVMVGRAAVRQPWIFAEAKKGDCHFLGDILGNSEPSQKKVPPGDSHLLETGLKFLELLAQYQPIEFQISRAKRFFSFFCDNIVWGNYLKNLLYREETLSGMEQVWQKYFHEQTGEK